LFDLSPDLGVGPIDGLLTGGKAVPSTGVGEPDRAACALVALVCPAVEAGLGESVDDAVLTCRLDIVYSTGQGRRSPQEAALQSAMTCTFMSCFLCFPE